MTAPCAAPIEPDVLLDYWTGALPDVVATRLEEHLFECGTCAGDFARLVALGAGIVTLVRQGRTSGILSRTLLNRLQREGMNVRTYSVSPGETLLCAAFPADDLLVVALRANLAGVDSVTVSITGIEGLPMQEIADVPVVASDGEVLWATSGAVVRQMPTGQVHVTLSASGGDVLAKYTLDHSALGPAREH